MNGPDCILIKFFFLRSKTATIAKLHQVSLRRFFLCCSLLLLLLLPLKPV